MPDLRADTPRSFADRLGLIGLYGFALFAFLGRDVANTGLVLMLVAALVNWQEFGRALGRRSFVLLSLLVLISAVLSVAAALWARPAEAGSELRGFGHFLQLWLFVLPAWWIAGQTRRTIWVLTLALIGFTLGTIKALDAEELNLLVNFRRPHFRWSINAIGQYAAAGLLGVLVLWPRFWRWSGGAWWSWSVRAALLCTMLLLLAGAIFSLSRGVWASFFVVVGILVGFGLYTSRGKVPRKFWALAVVGVCGLMAVVLLTENAIKKRLGDLVVPVAQFVSSGGDLAAVQDPSFNARYRILAIGFESWGKEPWIGQGPGAPRRIMAARRGDFLEGENFNDFHSLPVDWLVSFGGLGLFAMALAFLAVLHCARLGHRAGCLPSDLFLLAVGLSLFNVLCQMTDTRIFSVHGRFYWILVTGVACSCWLRAGLDRRNQVSDSPIPSAVR